MLAQYLPVPWKDYHTLAQSLAEKILADNKKFDEIVAISRGGLTLGHLLTDLLRIPISTIYDLACRGKIRGVKFGKHWRFLEEDIWNYFKAVPIK